MLDDADFNTAAMFVGVLDGDARRPGLRADVAAAACRAKHHDEIVELVKNNFALVVRYGDPADPTTYMGPLISEKQRDKVDGMVKRAVARQAPRW